MSTRIAVLIAAVVIPLVVWGAISIYRHLTRVDRRLRFLLEALDASDTSLRFPTTADRHINLTLNRIAESLSDLRIRVSETEKYYESITSAIATGVIVVSDGGHVLLTNPAALRLLGRPALTHISSLRDSWPELVDLLDPLPADNKDTTVRQLAVKTTSFVTRGGHRRLIVTLDDISLQLTGESVRSWTDMTRVLSHEIMNGIAPVTSIADTLRLRYISDPPEGDYMTRGLDTILESTRSLSRFVANYRSLSSLPAPVPEIFPLRPLIDHTIQLARNLDEDPTTAQEVTFRLDLPLSPVSVRADRGQTGQVLLNLIKNAIEAGAARITIRIRQHTPNLPTPAPTPGRVSIDIENDGQPISAENTERIFTPFFTTRQGGSGIGLSLSRRLVLANGGNLTLTSTPSAPITRFTLTLPHI